MTGSTKPGPICSCNPSPPPRESRVLDLGGNDGSFAERVARRRPDLSIVVADVDDAHAEEVERRGFRFVRIDEDTLPFDDDEFDVVLSVSVIEHATLPREECYRDDLSRSEWDARAWDGQRRFAAEARRVGRGLFIQTPHPSFPMDLHLWLPFVQHLPRPALVRLARFTEAYWIKKLWGPVDWRYLSVDEMRMLFPGAEISVERLAGVPKSIIAYRSAE